MLFNYEYEKKLRVGYIGAGEHSYRNILPCFQYAPIDLVALAEEDTDHGLAIARQFGAKRFYPKYQAMLAKEELDAVFIVVPPDEDGHPRYPELATETLKAGFHTWIEAPPASNGKEISEYTNACLKSHKYIATGLKKMFAPAYLKVAQIMEDPAFGKTTSFSMRYPVVLPPTSERKNPKAVAPFLEFVQPFSVIMRLFGEVRGLSYLRTNVTGPGDVVVNLECNNGVVGNLHLTGNQAATSPLERLEVIGTGANVVVENGVRLTYYRPGGTRGEGDYGRITSFIGPDETAPIIWEPEFSLGQLYNKQLFLEGYVGCIQYFAEMLLAGKAPHHGNLVGMLHIMSVCDKIRDGKERDWLAPY